jgi:hypothetical protein
MEQIECGSETPSQPRNWLNSNAVSAWIITQKVHAGFDYLKDLFARLPAAKIT